MSSGGQIVLSKEDHEQYLELKSKYDTTVRYGCAAARCDGVCGWRSMSAP